MFYSIPINIFSNDISMFLSQVKQNCWSIRSFVVFANQAVVNNAFVFCKVPIKLIFCPGQGFSHFSGFLCQNFEYSNPRFLPRANEEPSNFYPLNVQRENPLPKFRVTLITFIILDAKMHLQMSFVMIFIFISIGTVLTFIKIIIMNPHMFFQFGFCCKT